MRIFNRASGCKFLIILGYALVLTGCEYVDDMPVTSRYIAKNICTGLFVAGYEEEQLITDFITPIIPQIKSTWRVSVDHDDQAVTVTNSVMNNVLGKAYYRPPIGCVHSLLESREALLSQVPQENVGEPLDPQMPWPYGSAGTPNEPVAGVNYDAIQAAIDEEFVEPGGKNTVAVLVAYDNQLIAEQYDGGINEYSPLKGFSMSKSIINGLMGYASDRGMLEPSQVTNIAEWRGDARSEITLEQLMHMTSGLNHIERAIGDDNHQGQLFYGDIHQTTYALNKALDQTPGTVFNYSSADNIIAGAIIQDTFGGLQSLYDVYTREFLHRINAITGVIEHDEQGYMVNGESLLLSARDWARLGLLYLNKGKWNGETILSEDWIDYSFTSTVNPSYGANIWLNTGNYLLPTVAEDAFAFLGALERYVVVVPSRKAIIVRIGFSHDVTTVDMNGFVTNILAALPSD